MMSKYLILLTCLFAVCSPSMAEDSLEVQIGEKLFMEDRFSEWFFMHSEGQLNRPLSKGDPTLDKVKTDLGIFDHPFKGRQMSCAACHFVDQLSSVSQIPALTYNDFTSRTPIPQRNDGVVETTRHTSNMVGMALREGVPLHWDGEFFSGKDLSCASLVGRNMGWKLLEASMARGHIVEVLRQDDGTYPTLGGLNSPYGRLFDQVGLSIHELSDEQLFEKACEFISIYMQSLDFEKDEGGYIGSAYDQFLSLNGIRRQPKAEESSESYLDYLKDQILNKTDWKWLEPRPMKIHSHPSQFGDFELEGLKVFVGNGQCMNCHTPPAFTDFKFHATGLGQLEYEQIHGRGTFAKLKIPSQSERLANPLASFVATEEHPEYEGVFRQKPSLQNPLFVDLGVWNVFLHPDKRQVESQLRQTICRSLNLKDRRSVEDEVLLSQSVGMVKTPTLRSLGQSAPYFSNGIAPDLKDVMQIYMFTSEMAKRDRIVNSDPNLRSMHLRPHHFGAVEAFLRALDEDYE